MNGQPLLPLMRLLQAALGRVWGLAVVSALALMRVIRVSLHSPTQTETVPPITIWRVNRKLEGLHRPLLGIERLIRVDKLPPPGGLPYGKFRVQTVRVGAISASRFVIRV
jgi:hypothetical protein